MGRDRVAPAVAAVFARYPKPVRQTLAALRDLIFATAAKTEGVGLLEEALKWGQPSYLTPATRSGTTIRIDVVKSDPSEVALYVNCQTDLVAIWRSLYPDLAYEKDRAIRLPVGDPLPVTALRHCIALALTYHTRKKARHPA
ncbi:MAG: DUF1801 domain-containing protein [Bauldia sp.]